MSPNATKPPESGGLGAGPADRPGLPAVPGLDRDGRVPGLSGGHGNVKGNRLAHGPHGSYHRIQAPADRAMAARTATAHVKRARFAFTE